MTNETSTDTDWNPVQTTEDVVEALDVSGGRASITMRPWSGRERLAYEDAVVTRALTTDAEGDDTARLGTLRLVAMSLTLRGAAGFPNRPDGSAMFTKTKGRALATCIEDDLLTLNEATFAEIQLRCLTVNPLPGSQAAVSEAGDEGAGAGDGEDESTLPDPSSASSTRPTPADDADA